MASTTLTTLAHVVPDEWITSRILDEARARVVVEPLVFRDQMGEGQGVTYNRAQLPTGAAASVTEASDITAGSRTPTQASATVAEVGISTDLTDMSKEHAKAANDPNTWTEFHGRAVGVKIDGDLCGLFASLNSSTAVGTSGTDITVSNFITAIYTLDANNAPGQKLCVLHPVQVQHLMQAIQASTGTPWANLAELIRNGSFIGGQPGSTTGLIGGVFGIPVFGTTEVDNVNSDVDRCGAMFVRDAMIIAYGPRGLRTEIDRDASARVTEIVTTITYGVVVGQGTSTYGVPIETDDTV